MVEAVGLADADRAHLVAASDFVPPTIRAEKVERAAQDLVADFQRQGGSLTQAQFDRLVLRRNLSPHEMVSLLARLAALGVMVSEPAGDPTSAEDTASTAQLASPDDRGTNSNRRSPYTLLTHREEIELGRRVQLALRIQPEMDLSKVKTDEERSTVLRGRAARDRMTLANLRLVHFVVRNVRRPVRALDPWDLFQEGSVGLMRAVEKFDPELGLRFSTYAMWWIRQAIFRGLDDQDRTIRIPVHRLETLRRLKVVTRRLALELGHQPTVREVADAMNWPLEKTVFIQRLAQLDCISVDTPIGEDDGGKTVVETIAGDEPTPFEATQLSQRTDVIRRLLDRLGPRERLVIERRFGLGASSNPETLQQVGDDFGVTRERIRQIEEKALRRLRKWVDRQLHDALL